MNPRFCYIPFFALLFAACDKPKDSGDSDAAASANPRLSHSSRPRPESAVGQSKRLLRISLDEAMQIESPEDRDKAIAEIVKKALEIDAPLSAEAFRNLSSDSAEKLQLLEECARRLVARSQAESLAWADLLGSNADMVAAKGVIAGVLAETEPMNAVKILMDSGISLQDPEGAAVQVIQTWGASAPADAATWAASIPSVESRKVAIGAVISQWMMSDSKSAMNWMANLNDLGVRQEVSHVMVESLVGFPEFIRESILQNADAKTQKELEEEVEQMQAELEPPK